MKKKNLKLLTILILSICLALPQTAYGVTISKKGNNIKNLFQNDDTFPEFTTTDLDGNTMTRDDLTAKDVTMVNVWATYCEACINEMPELEKINKQLPDNAQIVGFVADVTTKSDANLDKAKKVIKDAGVTFPSMRRSNDLKDFLSDNVILMPTSFFLDSEGNIIDVVISANVDEYISIFEKRLDDFHYEK